MASVRFQGEELVLAPSQSVVIGRHSECQLRIVHDEASRRHARIQPGNGGYTIEDLGSLNGTWVNGERIQGRHQLAHGDRITVCGFAVEYLDPPIEVDTVPAPPVAAPITVIGGGTTGTGPLAPAPGPSGGAGDSTANSDRKPIAGARAAPPSSRPPRQDYQPVMQTPVPPAASTNRTALLAMAVALVFGLGLGALAVVLLLKNQPAGVTPTGGTAPVVQPQK